MRTLALLALISAAATTLPSIAAGQEGATSLHLTVAGKQRFEVLYSRAYGNATGAVIGGLIGAGIQSGIESDKDNDREAEVLPHLESDACQPAIESALSAQLTKAGAYRTYDTKPDGEHLRVEVVIDQCGFKLTNQETELVAAFAELRYKIYAGGSDKPSKYQRMLVLGKEKTTWPGLVANVAEAQPRFESALSKAGRRLANKFIYHR